LVLCHVRSSWGRGWGIRSTLYMNNDCETRVPDASLMGRDYTGCLRRDNCAGREKTQLNRA
jgi:hypothetical protein